jgi:hypothetical protein
VQMAINLSLLFLAGSLAIMLPLGIRYGRKAEYSFKGSIVRAAMWSIVGSWSLVIAGGGHGAGALPLPSIVAVLFAIFGKLSGGSAFLLILPHWGISPLVPIAGFVSIAAYWAYCVPDK